MVVYNWDGADRRQLLGLAFDATNGHDHDGVNSKAVTTTGPVAALTSGTVSGVTINGSTVGATTPAAGKFTTLQATGAVNFVSGTVSGCTLESSTIGATTAAAGKFTTIGATGALTFSTAAAGTIYKQGANGRVGTFVCNGITGVTVANTSIEVTDAIVISLNTVGGTVGAVPTVKTITAGNGFTVAGTASDTSTYNYAILKNAA